MKLYVGNIPHAYTEEDLTSLFEKYNVSSVSLIKDRETNRSRGFGFVEIESKDDALKAIEELNEKDCDGRKIIVNIAKPKKDNNNNRRNDRNDGRKRFSSYNSSRY